MPELKSEPSDRERTVRYVDEMIGSHADLCQAKELKGRAALLRALRLLWEADPTGPLA